MSENEKQGKKIYQKWWVWVIGLILLLFIWQQADRLIDEATTKEIPNVMGINYADAETVLKEKGFKVTLIETDAESILSNDIHNRNVKKGFVFKINDETNPDYDYGTTKDKNITIYYAKDDYIFEKAEEKNKEDSSDVKKEKTVNEKSDSANADDWRQFLKDYEAWADSYVEFLKKYKENPTNAKLLAEYGKYMDKMVEWSDKADKYQKAFNSDDLPSEYFTEYMTTLGRILDKLSKIE